MTDRNKISPSVIEQIKADARSLLSGSRGSHDWDHTERVMKLALHICEKEGADPDIVIISAILHDVGRPYEDEANGRICHAEKGAAMAREILEKYNLSARFIEQVCISIGTHRYRNNRKPETKEAKVLYDADKLDSIGAVGIGRAFLFAGEVGAKLHNKDADIENTEPYTIEDTAYREYMVKLRFVRDSILTAEGKRLAEKRHEFMEAFFSRLDLETDGIE